MKLRSRGRGAASILALLAAGALASCGTREDNSLGVALIRDRGELQAVRYFASQADSSDDFQGQLPSTNLGSSPAITVGSRPGYLARALVQFDAASLPAAGTVLDSAVVRFLYEDGLGAADSLPVGLHRVTAPWGESFYDAALFPPFLPAADTLTLSAADIGDTLAASLVSFAQTWVDRPDSNFGLALVPLDSTDLMLEYGARTSARVPSLTLHWKTGAGADTSSTAAASQDNSLYSKTASFVPLDGQPGRLTVGRGFPTSSLMALPVPDLGERATVNRATLTLHVDQAQSSLSSVLIRLQRVADSSWSADSTLLDVVAHGLKTITSATDSVDIDVAQLVQDLSSEGNYGVLLRAHEDRTDTDYVRFHGPDTEVAGKEPTLRVWYTPEDEVEP
ncbi:MAG: DNRLRE domain-containing protein [Candidatus Eiseniibacteriota bacterium]